MTRRAATLATLSLAVACAGDGSEIPALMSGPGDSITPTLAELQAEIFTPLCAACHRPGGIGPMPLDSESATFANLVGVASVEIPALLRVAPGDPDGSYLVWKIEGRPGIVGERMPLGAPALSGDQIDDVVAWIADGAMP